MKKVESDNGKGRFVKPAGPPWPAQKRNPALADRSILWKIGVVVCVTALAVISYFLPYPGLAEHHAAIMLSTLLLILALCGLLLRDFARLFRLQKAQIERFMGMNLALTSLIDLKDHYTEGHSKNVRDLARGFAEYLALSAEQVQDIALAAQLHDIGKIGIPDAVLKKPTVLTPEEFAQVKRHPDLGADAIETVEDYGTIVSVIRHHHERFDGSGYPYGLKGQQIPLGSRIIALADTYDALIHGRAYRDPVSRREAITLLRQGRGTQFDADLVDPFVRFIQYGSIPASLHDPVCGMAVDGFEFEASYAEKTYVFCSRTCLREFERQPEKYALSN